MPKLPRLPKPSLFSEQEEKQKESPTFESYYQPYTNWQDDPEIDANKMLLSWYPAFFDHGQIDYDKLKKGIEKIQQDAKELFKNLFQIKYRLKSGVSVSEIESLQKTIDAYGHRIIAHGVEEMKGGMHNLLLMCIANKVNVDVTGWGEFKKGPPNSSPLCHGPYYVVASVDGNHPNSYPTIEEMAYILVPFPEIKEKLAEQLTRCLEQRLVTPEQKSQFLEKCIDYQAFYQFLKTAEPNSEPSTSPSLY